MVNNIDNHQKDKIVWGRERAVWIAVRQGLLLIVDAIERYLEMEKRTADLRKILNVK
jgi:hypothetical protein